MKLNVHVYCFSIDIPASKLTMFSRSSLSDILGLHRPIIGLFVFMNKLTDTRQTILKRDGTNVMIIIEHESWEHVRRPVPQLIGGLGGGVCKSRSICSSSQIVIIRLHSP